MDEFRILGPVEALIEGRVVGLGAPKQRAVLARLLLARSAVVSRDQLVESVWGDEPPESPAASLQVYVHGLRRVLGAERLERHGSGYRMRLAEGELDLERFERLVASSRRALEAGDADDAAADIHAALELWRGPALADLADEPVGAVEAGVLEESRLRAFELRNEVRLALGEHDGLVGELERLIADEPYRERLREQYVLALYRCGRQKEALEAYQAARRMLIDELGVEPGSGLRDLERRILRQDASLAAPEPRRQAKTFLPAPATPLVGRRLEVAAVGALLRSEGARLVTLTGPGGTGKTRLAIATAEELAPELRDGAVFVDLSRVRDPALLIPTIAQTLGIREDGNSLEVALGEHLRPRRILLVLDNLEQLLEGVPSISALLAAAPRLCILATSREPLRLYGEHRYSVPPLSVPEAAETSLEALAANDAVGLFLARARAVAPRFSLSEENAPPVAEICRRLDGLPLAIELAAARSDDLTPLEMAREFSALLDLLTGGARDLPQRQQTLRATIEWSYELLSEPERNVFACLGVFAGGWSLAAACAVCEQSPSELKPILTALATKNLCLLEADTEGESRYRMLETIRAYSRERLFASSRAVEVARRHADFFLDLAEKVDQSVRAGGVDPVPLLDRIERDHDNLRAALDHLHDDDDEVACELRLGSALQYFWVVRGHHNEGRLRLEQALARGRPEEPRLLAKALASAGRIAYRQGDFEQARQRYTESLAAARSSGDDSAIGQALSDLAGVASEAGDHDHARQLYGQSAQALRRAGNTVRLGTVLNNSAGLYLESGEPRRARALAQEALALQDQSGDKEGRIFTLATLAQIAIREDRDCEAAQLLHKSLTLAREVGYKDESAHCLLAIGQLTLRHGDAALAAKLGGAADTLFESIGMRRLRSDDQTLREALLSGAERELGADPAQAAWDSGRTAPPDLADSALKDLIGARDPAN